MVWQTTIRIALVVVFVLGIGGGLLADVEHECDHSAAATSQDHCFVHCGCHALNLPSVNASTTGGDRGAQTRNPSSERLKLPLFADEIFNPPKA